jgi:transcriptional regulator with XRE-family HTH domain
LGRRIADCRERRGWKQKTLAERADLSVTFLSEVENDHRAPGSDALLRLSEALGASLDYLMKGVVDTEPGRGPLVLPQELAAIADEEGWSVGEASDVLRFHEMVVARRSRGGDDDAARPLTKDEWRKKFNILFRSDLGAEPST